MDYRQMTSPCGLDCFNCPLYRANTDESLRNMFAEKLGIPAESAVCGGCRNQSGTVPATGRHSACYTFQCAKDKGHVFCHECGDFPCGYFQPYADQADQRPHNTKVFNSCLIRKMGVEKWATEKAGCVKERYFTGSIKLND